MRTKLEEIARKARSCRTTKFTSLAHVLTPAFLRESWEKLNKRGTYGVDEVTTAQYREHLEENLHTVEPPPGWDLPRSAGAPRGNPQEQWKDKTFGNPDGGR